MKENRVEDLADSRFCKWAQIALVLIWIPILRVLSIWLLYALAAGLSSLALILVSFSLQPKQSREGFARGP